MTIDAWLEAAVKDAEKRGLPELKPLLEALAQATRTLRAADFNDVFAAPDADSRARNAPTDRRT